MSSRSLTIDGSEKYSLSLVDTKISNLIEELAIEEFARKASEEEKSIIDKL